ncbi:MAG: lipocalin family protein [Bacteroidetes bacterium]|nr:lipocalin family protein [Bacteroidota bacterium]
MKQAVMLIALTLVLASCNTTKTVRDSKKIMKGDWTLSSITYNQQGTFNVLLLDDASKACFEGSTWQFIPNNNTGIYTINSENCSTGERFFIFTIQEIDSNTGLYDFLLKPTNEKKKSKTNNSGFRLQLTQLSDTTMQWQQTVSLEGNPFIINMNFSKTQN